jgi:ribosome-binding factor A
MATTRQRKVQELLVQEISDIVRRELKDPRIGFVTITDAQVTPDLRHARVFFSVLGEAEQREETGKALNRASGFVRGEFARRAQMRYVPDIRFEFDTALERGLRISQLLEQVRQDDNSAPGSPTSPKTGEIGTADEAGGGADPASE